MTTPMKCNCCGASSASAQDCGARTIPLCEVCYRETPLRSLYNKSVPEILQKIDLSDYQSAVAMLEELLKMTPEHSTPSQVRLDLCKMLGRVHVKMKEYSNALTVFREIEQVSRANMRRWITNQIDLALLFLEIQSPSQAIQELDRAILSCDDVPVPEWLELLQQYNEIVSTPSESMHAACVLFARRIVSWLGLPERIADLDKATWNDITAWILSENEKANQRYCRLLRRIQLIRATTGDKSQIDRLVDQYLKKEKVMWYRKAAQEMRNSLSL